MSGGYPNLLSWALASFIAAIICAIFGFSGIATGAESIAKLLFLIFLLAFIVSLIVGLAVGEKPPSDHY